MSAARGGEALLLEGWRPREATGEGIPGVPKGRRGVLKSVKYDWWPGIVPPGWTGRPREDERGVGGGGAYRGWGNGVMRWIGLPSVD